MSVPLTQLTVEEAHKEFNSLVDRIATKYESNKFGAVGIPGFNAKSAKLAVLFAHMSQLCQRLNLSMSAQLHRLLFFKHFWVKNCTVGRQSWLGSRGCSFIPIHM